MKFEDFKKQFDDSFGKVTPKEFIQRMENLGYEFIEIEDKIDAIEFANWLYPNNWNRSSKHDGIVYWSNDSKRGTVSAMKTTQELYDLFKQSA